LVSEYEQNATECRQKAAQTTDPQLKKQLGEVAEVWDRLARECRHGIVETKPNPIQRTQDVLLRAAAACEASRKLLLEIDAKGK